MIRYITVHHTATSRDNTNIKAIRKDHRKKYGRLWYGKIITPDGTIHEHDEWNNRGFSRLTYDIAVTGDFREGHDFPTNKQLYDLHVVIEDLMERYDIAEINGHNTQPGASKSACPGKLMEYYDERVKNKERFLYQKPGDKHVWAILWGERYWVPSTSLLDNFIILPKNDIYNYPYSGKMAVFLTTDEPK